MGTTPDSARSLVEVVWGVQRDLFTFRGLVLLRTARGLVERRVSRSRISRALEKLRAQVTSEWPLSSVALQQEGDEIVVGVGAVLSLGLAVGLVLNVPLLRDSAEVTQLDRYTMHIVDAVDALPKEAAGQKVLNCTFPEGEVLLDRRPDVRFVDVLDPTYLERFDKDRHQARLLLIDGSARDVKAIVTETFGAQYVICGYPQAKRLLDDHPDFVRIRPPPGPPLPPGSGPSVYEVRRR